MSNTRTGAKAKEDADRLIAEAIEIREELLVTATRLSVFSEQLTSLVSGLKDQSDRGEDK